MKSYGSIGQNLGNIGINLGSTAANAYQQGGTALMNANQMTGLAQAQLPYAIGQQLMNYNKVDPNKNLELQSKYYSNLGYRQ